MAAGYQSLCTDIYPKKIACPYGRVNIGRNPFNVSYKMFTSLLKEETGLKTGFPFEQAKLGLVLV